MLEQVYEVCLMYEFDERGIKYERQKRVPVRYKGKVLDANLRYDLLVENCIVVELKAVMEMVPIFDAQVLSYARLLEVLKAMLINFTCHNIFKEGQKTFVNDIYRFLPDE